MIFTKKGFRYEEPDWKWGDRGSRRKWVKILPLAFPRQHVEGAHTTPRQCGGGFVNVPKIKCPIFQVETKHKMPLPTIHKDKSHIQTADYSDIILKMKTAKLPSRAIGILKCKHRQKVAAGATSRGTGQRSTGRPCVSSLTKRVTGLLQVWSLGQQTCSRTSWINRDLVQEHFIPWISDGKVFYTETYLVSLDRSLLVTGFNCKTNRGEPLPSSGQFLR